MTEKLKPCPFCGGTASQRTEHDSDMVRWGYVGCGCGVRTRGKFGDLDPITWTEIRDEWNRRASPDMEQRAGFVMVPPDDSEPLRLAVRAVKQTLFSGGSGVALPADSWIERAFIAGMLAAAHPIEALEGGKTDQSEATKETP